MSCCRALLRSSTTDAYFLRDRVFVASFRKAGCSVSDFIPPSLSVYPTRFFLRRCPESRPVPFIWERYFHTSFSHNGRYIAATECEGSAASNFDNFDGFEESKWFAENSDTESASEDDRLFESQTRKENYMVVNFYVLVAIDDPHLEVARHSAFVKDKDIRGRILISSQGINAQYSGPYDDVVAYANWVKEDARFASLYTQISPSFDGHAFPRLKLRYKPSLVQVEGGTAKLPITDPSSRAIPLSPGEWKERITGASCELDKDDGCDTQWRSFLILDVRNGYEWDIGHFKGAERPPVDCFKSTEFGLQCNEVESTN
ncbi:hypothetical protein KP509_31G062300 [Ceratopteris richardii]|uniref:Rhodanese domain-containing protein n=1 Tax=Ceratopteris richardii TaxID=49495 RepID=A0A8T2R0T2_CERRI|nr:hypothetical protein KP509_31G062300 [Ceratopteris richardii]